jgi:hypothetical protein
MYSVHRYSEIKKGENQQGFLLTIQSPTAEARDRARRSAAGRLG